MVISHRLQRFQKCEYAKTKLFKTEGRGWGLLADESIKVITLQLFHILFCFSILLIISKKNLGLLEDRRKLLISSNTKKVFVYWSKLHEVLKFYDFSMEGSFLLLIFFTLLYIWSFPNEHRLLFSIYDQAGQFIIEYCGEIISSEEAKQRFLNYEVRGKNIDFTKYFRNIHSWK